MADDKEAEQAKAKLEKAIEKLGSAPELDNGQTTDESSSESETSQSLDAAESTPTSEAPEPTPAADSKNAEVAAPSTEDVQTDKAVDDIMKKDGDDVLKAQDEAAEAPTVMKNTRWEQFKNWNARWWANPKKRWATVIIIVVLIGGVFALPLTRYNALGLVLKSSVTVQVVDSKTGTPVSGATVELSGKTAETQANGKASLHVNMGSGSLKVSKKYYTGYTHGELVGMNHNSFKATLVATGRQVRVKVVNKVTGKVVSGATVTAGGAHVKTDKNGLANLVIPSGATTQAGTVTLNGYNTGSLTVTASDDLSKNTFSLVPAGKLYFLSNLSGKIDVVKTNLDGTDRQTVLAGTGNEDRNSTSLLASRDWKYLALLSKRAGSYASVYLIDTTNNDKLTTIDEGNANFNLVGWSGDQFVYQVTRNTVSDWQPNQQALKSFDPTTGHNLLLDQTQGAGDTQNNYVKQSFSSSYLIGNQVVYAKNWQGYAVNPLDGKSVELDSIAADGSGHKVLKSFPYTAAGYDGYSYRSMTVSTQLYEPDGLYVQVSGSSEGTTYYDYDNGKITADSSLNENSFYGSPYPTYLLSPSGNSTFWADQRDGKNTLFVGDQDAKNQKQIASLSDYNAYAWYTDNYVLVSRNSSELYIMGKDGGTPLKITDYYKPAINYQGYGGGYGGL